MKNNFYNRNENHKQIFSKIQSYTKSFNKFQRIYGRINIYLDFYADWKSGFLITSQIKTVPFGAVYSLDIITKSCTFSDGASRMGIQLTYLGGKITDPSVAALTIRVNRLGSRQVTIFPSLVEQSRLEPEYQTTDTHF